MSTSYTRTNRVNGAVAPVEIKVTVSILGEVQVLLLAKIDGLFVVVEI